MKSARTPARASGRTGSLRNWLGQCIEATRFTPSASPVGGPRSVRPAGQCFHLSAALDPEFGRASRGSVDLRWLLDALEFVVVQARAAGPQCQSIRYPDPVRSTRG